MLTVMRVKMLNIQARDKFNNEYSCLVIFENLVSDAGRWGIKERNETSSGLPFAVCGVICIRAISNGINDTCAINRYSLKSVKSVGQCFFV